MKSANNFRSSGRSEKSRFIECATLSEYFYSWHAGVKPAELERLIGNLPENNLKFSLSSGHLVILRPTERAHQKAITKTLPGFFSQFKWFRRSLALVICICILMNTCVRVTSNTANCVRSFPKAVKPLMFMNFYDMEFYVIEGLFYSPFMYF